MQVCCGFNNSERPDRACVLRNVPDNLNSSSDAILTDMSWEKRSFWGQANISQRLLVGSLFSLAPKVLKFSRWEAGGVSSAGGGSTSMGSAFTFTFWYWASLLLSGKKKRNQPLLSVLSAQTTIYSIYIYSTNISTFL